MSGRYRPPELLAANHDLTRFECRSREQTDWLRRHARQSAASGTTKVFVPALADMLGVTPGWQDDGPSRPVVEIAIYPDVVWLAARSLRAHSAGHRAAV